ncbi:MAG: hypothetical protein ACT4P6_11395 [Gemmatimonadaceae bacterium]
MSRRAIARMTLLAATLAAGTACTRTVASHGSRSLAALPSARPSAAAAELLLDTELSVRECKARRQGVTGYARMKVSDAKEIGATSELEYELRIENPDRLPLSEAVIALSGMGIQNGPGETIVPLWTGETSHKERLRMRGIVALPRGISTTDIAVALRERRSALQLRVADQNGAAAACGDLRN